LNVFNFLSCRFDAMADLFGVHAQFNGGEPQRLKVRHLGVTLKGIKNSTPERQGGWNTFGINVRPSTMREYHSLGWN